jgi:hypothetical protein
LPKSVKEALKIDQWMGTTLWRDSVAKDMKKILLDFKFDDDDSVPLGYYHIVSHMISDVKMIVLIQKLHVVLGGT